MTSTNISLSVSCGLACHIWTVTQGWVLLQLQYLELDCVPISSHKKATQNTLRKGELDGLDRLCSPNALKMCGEVEGRDLASSSGLTVAIERRDLGQGPAVHMRVESLLLRVVEGSTKII